MTTSEHQSRPSLDPAGELRPPRPRNRAQHRQHPLRPAAPRRTLPARDILLARASLTSPDQPHRDRVPAAHCAYWFALAGDDAIEFLYVSSLFRSGTPHVSLLCPSRLLAAGARRVSSAPPPARCALASAAQISRRPRACALRSRVQSRGVSRIGSALAPHVSSTLVPTLAAHVSLLIVQL